MKRPHIDDYQTEGSMIAPYGLPDFPSLAIAQDQYIDHIEKQAQLYGVFLIECQQSGMALITFEDFQKLE